MSTTQGAIPFNWAQHMPWQVDNASPGAGGRSIEDGVEAVLRNFTFTDRLCARARKGAPALLMVVLVASALLSRFFLATSWAIVARNEGVVLVAFFALALELIIWSSLAQDIKWMKESWFREMIAYHEAGHALAVVLLLHPEDLEQVCLAPSWASLLRHRASWEDFSQRLRASSAGHITWIENEVRNEDDMALRLKVSVAGCCAEEVVFGKSRKGNSRGGDWSQMRYWADQIAHGCVKGSPHRTQMSAEAESVVQVQVSEVQALLESHRPLLDAFAQAVLKEHRLGEDRIRELLADGGVQMDAPQNLLSAYA